MENKIVISATGDSLLTQRFPRDEKGLADIHRLLMQSDVRFTNLEATIHDFDEYPSATSGGDWTAARPAALSDLKWLGFNLMAFANNHTLDWTYGGLLKTMQHLDREGIVHTGVGRNLAEAGAPKYCETANGRVALIAATSTCHDWHVAGAQRPDVPGRPGVNPLRFKTVHRISEDQLEKLKEISAKTEINHSRYYDEIEGFLQSEEGLYYFGKHLFELGEPGTVTRMDETDAKRIAKSIQEARRQADVVLVSHHAHEAKGLFKDQPADFNRDFAHMCMDAGAHAYIGHGPHILRGIEVYRGRPILYSLGDFMRQAELLDLQPTEFFNIYGLGPEHSTADGFDAKNRAPLGIRWNCKAFESVIVSFEVENGGISQLTLRPITLGMDLPRSRRGCPTLASADEGDKILRQLQELSDPFGTRIQVNNGIGVIRMDGDNLR